MYPNVNTQLQIRKLWVPLKSALYIFVFWLDLFQCLSIISTRCPPEKKHKETIHFFKTIMFHPSTAPLSNSFKLKRISKIYPVLYNDSARGNTMSKCQRIHKCMRKVCALLYHVHTTTDTIVNCNWPRVLVQLHTQRRFCANQFVRVSNSGHPVTYARQFFTNKPGHKIY